jgi:23S rRNA pseudouridine955/2504/2580 synthase
MSGVQILAVDPEDSELRLDRWFKRHYPGLGHGRLEKLLRTGQIRIDGKRARAGDRLTTGQNIRVPPLEEWAGALPTHIPISKPRDSDLAALRAAVIYRDDDVIVLNKPAGLAVQGGTGTVHHLDGLLDALRFEAAERPRLVHRLDKDTSGVLLLARSAPAAAALALAFRSKAARKVYWAVVVGLPLPRQGKIDMALAKLPGRGGEKMTPEEDGKSAVTYYSVIENAGDKASFVALLPVTGRTHQLRAHCLLLGTPILGDGKYGGADSQIAGAPGVRHLHLHARSIALPHPRGGVLQATAPLPPHMLTTWRFFGFPEKIPDPFAELEF